MASGRRTTWVDTLVGFTVANGAQGLVSLATGVSPTFTQEATILRTIYKLYLMSTTVAGAWGVQQVDLGWAVASQEAFAAGTVPDPAVATDFPRLGWMHRERCMATQNGTGTGIYELCMGDSRAKRIISRGEPYLVVDSSNLLGTSFTIEVRGLIRQLYLMA